MKKILASILTTSLIVGCSTTVKSEEEVSYYSSIKPINDYYYVDKRSGCLIGSFTGRADSGIVNIFGPDGKPVGCDKAGGMSIDEYFKLKSY